jgi:four helix bundle protein
MRRDHRKLKAFQTADSLVIDVYRETRILPVEERFGLQAQIRRAAISAATNIVEGSARSSTAEYCRFLEIAMASAREVAYLIGLAARLEFLASQIADGLVSRYGDVQGSLINIIRSLSPASSRALSPKALSPKP